MSKAEVLNLWVMTHLDAGWEFYKGHLRSSENIDTYDSY